MLLSADNIIELSLLEARVIYPGESLPESKAELIWNYLNLLLESWALEGLMVKADVLESFALTAGLNVYTYGTGGDFNSSAPVIIYDSTFVHVGDTDYPCTLISLEQYRNIPDKLSSGTPERFTYNPEHPLVKVYFYPTPDSTDSVYIKSSKELISFADRVTEVDIPRGYARAIISNLGVDISNLFGKDPLDSLVLKAKLSKKAVKSSNRKNRPQLTTPHLTAMANGGGGINILQGPFG